MTSLWLFKFAFLLHLFALALYWVYATRPSRLLSHAALAAFGAGVLAQLMFFGLQWATVGVPPLTNAFQALSLWTLAVSVVFVWSQWRWRLGLLGAFVAPLVALTLFMGFRFAKLPASQPPLPDINSFFLIGHVALAMAGYACFTLAFGIGLAWLLQERQLKSHELGEMFYELPALVELEHMARHSLKVGVCLLALGLAMGFWWRSNILQQGLVLDSKSLVGLGALIWYGGIVAMRRHGRTSARLMLLGFVILFFAYYLANTFGGGHAY